MEKRRGKRLGRSRLVVLTINLAAVLVLTSVPAAAQTDPYGSDPLGLISFKDQTDTYSTGIDAWEVWVCDVPDGSVSITPAQAANILNASITPYFQALSANLYRPVFSAGAIVTATSPSQWPSNPFRLQGECEGLVSAQGAGVNEGAIVIVDAAYAGGYATGGYVCEVVQGCPNTYPANARIVVLGGGTMVVVGGSPAALRTAAHELGHAVFWPHSFAGLVTFENGVVYEYDNPMDLMSGGDSNDLNIGTIAINRYASGWFGSEGVIFHRGGNLVYTIGATTGTQMVVLPTDQQGVFETLGARIRTGYDFGIPAEGVEVYQVDQNSCSSIVGGCFGLERRTYPVPAVESFSSSSHVFGVGDVFTVRGMTISVLERVGEGYRIRVEGQAVAERFVDDNGNIHEVNIEAIAAVGITRGCNPPLVDRFCPSNDVTRAEMAAFLIAALGEQPSPTFVGAFPDVAPGQWYTGYVERLKELGITTGNADGTYGPDRPVTRAEMAVFLNRAFQLGLPTPGAVFGDVPADQWYAQAVEAIRQAGITTGCSASPVLYCPIDPVKRDQMATFVARALGI